MPLQLKYDSVRWGRFLIHYDYHFAERKTLAISVHPDLRVEVKAPMGTELLCIREKVHKRAPWIRKTKKEFELYMPKQPPRRYIGGETHRYLGRQYRLKIINGDEAGVKCYRGCLWVTCLGDVSAQTVKTLIFSWYRQRAELVFKQAVDEYVPRILGSAGMSQGVVIRLMKTRWGSCTKTGKIILNLELIKAPRHCIEYVVVHELCHLLEHNHGSRFWKRVERAMPDYEKVRARLNLFADC